MEQYTFSGLYLKQVKVKQIVTLYLGQLNSLLFFFFFLIKNESASFLIELVYTDSNFNETWDCQLLVQFAALSFFLNSHCIFIWF